MIHFDTETVMTFVLSILLLTISISLNCIIILRLSKIEASLQVVMASSELIRHDQQAIASAQDQPLIYSSIPEKGNTSP